MGGVTPQNERMQEILRMTQGLDPMQVLRLRQALGEQVNQVRGVALSCLVKGMVCSQMDTIQCT